MKKIILILLFFTVPLYLFGQDIHFSQFFNAPLQINPSNAGLIKGKFRVGINSKNQWSSVTKPYQTISTFFDMQFFKKRYRKDALGLGVLFNADIAGDSKYSTLYSGIAITYIKSVSFRNNQFISIGIMPGILQNSIDFSALTYDNQFNGNYFDPNIPHNEQTGKKSILNFDVSAGLQWLYQPSLNNVFNLGFSVFHISEPRIGLLFNNKIRLDRKYTLHGNAKFGASSDLDIVPSLMMSKQGPFFEAVFGTMLKYNRSKSYIDETSLNFGLYYRYSDALVIMTGFEYKNVNLGVSYDLNLSRLRIASKIRGGLEFSVSYIYNNNKSRRAKDVPCPIF